MMPARGWTDAECGEVLDAVARRTGLSFSHGGLNAGIRRLAARSGDDSAARLIDRLGRQRETLDQLLAEVTVGETYFFREPGQLDFIRREILPTAARERGSLRMWSAGCATGEEAYTLAILAHEAGLLAHTTLLGTDLAPSRLATARAARFTPWSLRGVPEPVVERYFRRSRGRYALAEEIRRAAEFRVLNLAEASYPSTASGVWGMDLVLCRNVLIYLDPATITRVAGRLLASLAPGGWLVLGASDPPLADLVPCEVVITDAGIAYRRATRARSTLPSGSAPAAPARAEPAAVAAPPAPPRAAPGVRPAERSTPAPGVGALAEAIARVRELADRGGLEAAGIACTAALDRHRDSAELASLHATLLALGGRHREAAEAARRVLYLDRDLVIGHLQLGLALARLGDARGAVRSLRIAERRLAAEPPDAAVPAAGDACAGALLEMVRMQFRLLAPGGPA